MKFNRSDCFTNADSIPINLIEIVAEEIVSPSTEVINNAILHSIFPDQWKIAKLFPIPNIDIPSTVTWSSMLVRTFDQFHCYKSSTKSSRHVTFQKFNQDFANIILQILC